MMSRWEALFGTPEKAVETLDFIVNCFFYDEDYPSPDLRDILCALRGKLNCEGCILCPAGNREDACHDVSAERIAEWLKHW